MRAFVQTRRQLSTPVSSSNPRRHTAVAGLGHREHPLLHWQRTIGNQAVLRMLAIGRPRQPDSDRLRVDRQGSPEEPSLRSTYSAHEGEDLRNNLWDLAEKNVTAYGTYQDTISRATAIEQRVALNTVLLSKLHDTLAPLSFARCVESLGRRAPTFDELRKHPVVVEAINAAWSASDVGTRDLVTEPHEEGGWVFMNLIDGSLSTARAKAEGTDFIRVEPPPDVDNSVLVAIFHTHPHLGRAAKPSRPDLVQDQRRGVPNLVAGNTGSDPTKFQIYLSGPPARKHLASTTKIPGPSGGIPP